MTTPRLPHHTATEAVMKKLCSDTAKNLTPSAKRVVLAYLLQANVPE